jgi:predicted DNA-binding helix-hairpin-helix protein
VSTEARQKFLPILRMMYSADPAVDHPIAQRALKQMDETQLEQFKDFQIDVGNLFIEFKEELDAEVEELSDDFSDPDPRKWSMGDWGTFEIAVTGSKYEEIIRAYAHGKENIHLIWKEIEQRLDLN